MARSGRLLSLLVLSLALPAGGLRAESEGAEAGISQGVDPGIGIFTRFPLKFSVSVQGGYDDNVNTASSGFEQGAGFVTTSANITLELQTPRLSVSTATALGFTYYGGALNSTEPNLNLPITIGYKVSPRLQVGATILALYQQEPNFQFDSGQYNRVGNYFFTQDTFHADYIWMPRFSTVTSYGILAVHYDDVTAGMFQDRFEHTIGNQFRFLAWPTTSLIGEYRFGVVNYEHISRDSTTHTLLAGIDHQFSPRLTASFRGGEEFRHYQDFGDENSPHFEADVQYRFGKDTSASWNISYGLQEGNVEASNTRKSFHTGLIANRTITARIGASLSLFYNHDDYSAGQAITSGGPGGLVPAFSQDSFTISLSVRYAMTRSLGLSAGYDRTDVNSDGSTFGDYSRDRIWGGFNFSF